MGDFSFLSLNIIFDTICMLRREIECIVLSSDKHILFLTVKTMARTRGIPLNFYQQFQVTYPSFSAENHKSSQEAEKNKLTRWHNMLLSMAAASYQKFRKRPPSEDAAVHLIPVHAKRHLHRNNESNRKSNVVLSLIR